jgi:hypothetical protein
MLPLVVFPKNPDLEETLPPGGGLEQPDRDAARPPAEDLAGIWCWRGKPGRKIRFDDLAYRRFAIDSYGVFRRLRDEKVIPQGVRFQVSLPAPHSAIDGFFEDSTQWPDLYGTYRVSSSKRSSISRDRSNRAAPASPRSNNYARGWKRSPSAWRATYGVSPRLPGM